ncbi:Universal stress protein family protein [Variovorax sp. PBS-H4]|uniref:universal stress protein n=1 Tax=Variovorax sp. PBS-H4 TaxID=434008 RepID=UPI0013193FE1|nr:universal stress protein [Variovorax sp. PBS-H4]VTU36337.1 Universal stress protein family protein [Variovorax sp. PBS-H4]
MHDPKTILLHLDSSARAAERVRIARLVADAFDGEVVAQPCTMSALMRYPYALEGAAEAMAIMESIDKDCRDKAYATFKAAGGESPRLRWEEPMSDAPWGFARRALYADLLILGQRDPDDPAAGELPSDFVPSVLVESGRPALVVPYAGPVATIGRSVLIAWKETREAARALSAALPWLVRAQSVHAVSYGEDAEASLRSLQRYLNAQGVNAAMQHGDPDEREVGERVLSTAADVGADLLVMGCYGHSRAREWVLGGATRSMLQSMTLPVLMSH